MSWKSEVYDVIEQMCPVGGYFTLADMYQYADALQQKHPGNAHINDKIRQILQYLRDDGLIEFVDNQGEYKRVK